MRSRILSPATAVLIFSIMAFSFSLSAQKIGSVTFTQPSKEYKFDEDVFLSQIHSKKGVQFSERALNDDIKRLHSLGIFSDVVSETRKTPDGKIAINFRVMPNPIVERVIFRGNKKYDTKALSDLVTVSRGNPLNNLALQRSAAALRKFYRSKGLNDATIIPRQKVMENGRIRLIFIIDEKLRLRVASVSFKGAKFHSEGKLRDSIATQYTIRSHPWLSWIFVTDGLLDRDELNRDKIRLRELYLQSGHLDFTVKNVSLKTDPKDPEKVHVFFEVEEGKPYKVGKVTVSGEKRFKKEELLPLLALKPGSTYDLRLERGGASALESKYGSLGYADFVVRPRLSPNYRTHVVDVDYVMNEGRPFKINEIYISGNRYTKGHVIRRELPMVPGDPVDPSLVKMVKNRLMGMGYFKTVEAVAIKSDEGPLDTKDIDIKVTEKKFIDARIGGSWSDSDSLAGMLELSHSNMDILDPWNYFTGGGQRMRLLGVIGLERYNFELDFTEPWLFGIPLRFDISGYIRNIVYEDWEDRRIGFTTSLTKRIFDDFTTGSIGYTFEQVRIHEMDDELSAKFQEWKGDEFIGRVHLSLTRDTRNNAMNPTRGYYLNVLSALSSQALGGSRDYVRLEAKGSWHYGFLNDMFVASVGGKVGWILGNDIPLYERYFLGGGDSVRGFPYRSIGPEDYNNDNYGGASMYIFSAELSHPIYELSPGATLRGALFVDVGGAGEKSGDFGDVNVGVGYGFRIKLPSVAVPIRLDFAYPIVNSQDGVKNQLRFHFNIGASFSPP